MPHQPGEAGLLPVKVILMVRITYMCRYTSYLYKTIECNNRLGYEYH